MLASRTKVFALGAALTLLAAAVPGLRLRGEPMVLYRLGGVELQRVDRALLPHDERVDADDGDLLLSNGDIILSVGASTASAGRRLNYGAILDVAGRNFSDDAMNSFRVGLSIGTKRVNLKTLQVEPMRDARVPFLRVTAHDPESGLLVSTDVRLFEKKNTVELVTEVK